ncbi:hypothetical protein TNCV_85641 [Trichonephila clavipes]|nr:hypothetical protein TNCV_85641 [Trichonephila clavipes]
MPVVSKSLDYQKRIPWSSRDVHSVIHRSSWIRPNVSKECSMARTHRIPRLEGMRKWQRGSTHGQNRGPVRFIP